MTTRQHHIRADLAARVGLRRILRDAVALGAADDLAGSVAVAAARRLLREGCRDVARVETWQGVLQQWITTRTREGLL